MGRARVDAERQQLLLCSARDVSNARLVSNEERVRNRQATQVAVITRDVARFAEHDTDGDQHLDFEEVCLRFPHTQRSARTRASAVAQ